MTAFPKRAAEHTEQLRVVALALQVTYTGSQPVKPSQIAARTGLSAATVKNLLKELELQGGSSGALNVPGGWVWVV